jgi:hypothetical protein
MMLGQFALLAVTFLGAAQDFERRGVPEWTLDPEFKHDAFTFVRIRYQGTRRRWHRAGDWATDWPDSDLNFSFRLQQLTSMAVDPDGLVLELTDPRLFEYPFIYMIEPGYLLFREAEVQALRRYCLNGGFLMVDDFWDDDEWLNFYQQIKRVFPDREVKEVPLEHEIFHIVYDLKEKPQVPSIQTASRGSSWEQGTNTRTPHYRAIKDDQGRIMVFICHNTDLGDGWEREGEAEWYFQEYSVPKAYPMGINIVIYALTH